MPGHHPSPFSVHTMVCAVILLCLLLGLSPVKPVAVPSTSQALEAEAILKAAKPLPLELQPESNPPAPQALVAPSLILPELPAEGIPSSSSPLSFPQSAPQLPDELICVLVYHCQTGHLSSLDPEHSVIRAIGKRSILCSAGAGQHGMLRSCRRSCDSRPGAVSEGTKSHEGIHLFKL